MPRLAPTAPTATARRRWTMLKELVGSGHKIMLFTLPFVAATVILDLADPDLFAMGLVPPGLQIFAVLVLAAGVIAWAWSVALILIEVPRGQLITSGPYAVVRHPLYTAVALLVLPSLGVVLGNWLWVVIGGVLYIASRRFEGEEEEELALRFGGRWCRYRDGVRFPWL